MTWVNLQEIISRGGFERLLPDLLAGDVTARSIHPSGRRFPIDASAWRHFDGDAIRVPAVAGNACGVYRAEGIEVQAEALPEQEPAAPPAARPRPAKLKTASRTDIKKWLLKHPLVTQESGWEQIKLAWPTREIPRGPFREEYNATLGQKKGGRHPT